MLALLLWIALLYQRINIVKIVGQQPGKNLRTSKIRADLGLVFLGILAFLQISINIYYGLNIWNPDFISPLID
jgi:hypothetical protein